MCLMKKARAQIEMATLGYIGAHTQVAMGYENFIWVLMVWHWIECVLLLSYSKSMLRMGNDSQTH